MPPSIAVQHRSLRFRILFASALLVSLICVSPIFVLQSWAQIPNQAYIRVNQAGYETASAPYKALLMSTVVETGATFKVTNSSGVVVTSGSVGALAGNWATYCKLVTGKQATGGKVNNQCPVTSPATTVNIVWDVYPISFSVSGGDTYTIAVTGPVNATSPKFAVNTPGTLYPGMLVNSLFFYETQRDGPNYIQNALRTAPGHLNDASTYVYKTPPIDSNDYINNVPPVLPLVSAGVPNIDTTGGWWDAGDYELYIETVSYAAALMQVGVRDFPNQMGPNAPLNPPAPPASTTYAGNSGTGAPKSSDFSAEARYGVQWMMKMWNDTTKTLYYQVDNTQDWDYYGEGSSNESTTCGGTYSSPYCLLTEYDIWILPQAGDNYQQSGDPEACDPLTTYYICNRPAFIAAPAGSLISPNLAGRLAASFALYYQLNRTTNPTVANQALQDAEDIFALANTSPTGKLLTVMPFDGYGETVWQDDMELGATELYFALQTAGGNLPAGLPQTNPSYYLQQAATWANTYNALAAGTKDTLNLYDVGGLANYELYRAIGMAGNPGGLATTQSALSTAITTQVATAITTSGTDVWGFGRSWRGGDTTSHGNGLSVMAMESYNLTGTGSYQTYAQQWLGNMLGVNPWGSSFIVGDGSTFTNCLQHEVANLVGSQVGGVDGLPVLWGAAVEGPATAAQTGYVGGMVPCPANNIDSYAIFNGKDGSTASATQTVYQDDMQSYSTTEPGIDLTATSFLMWSWRLAGAPASWTSTALTASSGSFSPAQSTTLTATVVGTGANAPTGTVSFYLGSASGTLLGQGSLSTGPNSTSIAQTTVQGSALAAGNNSIVAYYSGDTNDGPSTSVALTVAVGQSGIYSPANGSTFTGSSANFQWYGYAGATGYWVDIGKEAGGNEYEQSGSLSSSTYSLAVNSLPVDGSTVYVTWYYLLNGGWISTGYTYTAFGGVATEGAMQTPAPGATLTSGSVTFTWSAGSEATAYWLDAGSSPGGTQYYQSGNLGNVLTTTVNSLPTNGSAVFATLYSLVGGSWMSIGYQYTAYNIGAAAGVLTTPTPGSVLPGASATFGWAAGSGASAYWLDVGSTPGGSQYSQSGNLGNVLTTTVNTLPTDGSAVYATLYSYIGGAWVANAYTYTSLNVTSGLAAMQTPAPGSTLSGGTVTFTWSADANATAYWVDISDIGPGQNDVYQSGNLGNVLTTTVANLPTDGSSIYVTLYSFVGGEWLYTGSTYVTGTGGNGANRRLASSPRKK